MQARYFGAPLTCCQGDIAIETALVEMVAGIVAAHDGRRPALALLAAQPHAAVALDAVGLVGTLIACEAGKKEGTPQTPSGGGETRRCLLKYRKTSLSRELQLELTR